MALGAVNRGIYITIFTLPSRKTAAKRARFTILSHRYLFLSFRPLNFVCHARAREAAAKNRGVFPAETQRRRRKQAKKSKVAQGLEN